MWCMRAVLVRPLECAVCLVEWSQNCNGMWYMITAVSRLGLLFYNNGIITCERLWEGGSMRFLTWFCMCAMLNQITCNCKTLFASLRGIGPTQPKSWSISPVTSILFTCKISKAVQNRRRTCFPLLRVEAKKWNYKSYNVNYKKK